MKKNQIIKKEDIIFKKPGIGVPENKLNYIVGKKLIKDVYPDRILKLKDIEL